MKKNKKGITPFIAIILLILIVISFAGVFSVWAVRMFEVKNDLEKIKAECDIDPYCDYTEPPKLVEEYYYDCVEWIGGNQTQMNEMCKEVSKETVCVCKESYPILTKKEPYEYRFELDSTNECFYYLMDEYHKLNDAEKEMVRVEEGGKRDDAKIFIYFSCTEAYQKMRRYVV